MSATGQPDDSRPLHRRRPFDVTVAVSLALLVAGVLGLLRVASLGGVAVQSVPGVAVVHAVVGSLAVLVLPGYVGLLAAGVRRRPRSKQLLYAVGLSVVFAAAVGLVTAGALPALGVGSLRDAPVVYAATLVALSALAWRRTRTWEPPQSLSRPSSRTFTWACLLFALPVVAVLTSNPAAVIPVSLQSPVIGFEDSLVPIAAVAAAVVFIGTDRVPRRLHPLAVWTISAAVLLEMTVVSSHVWGWDVHYAFYVAYRTLETGVWPGGLANPSASILTATLVPAVGASVTGFDLAWVYKLLVPLAVSTTPVALYHVTRARFDPTAAAVAPFVLVFYYGYFKIFPGKQHLSQFFLALCVLVLFDDDALDVHGRALAVVFCAGMVASHYGVSLFVAGFLSFAFVASRVLAFFDSDQSIYPPRVRPTLPAFVGVGWSFWFLASASGINFQRVVDRVQETFEVTESTSSSRGAFAYLSQAFDSPIWGVYKLLNIVLIGLVALGVAWTVYRVVVRSDGDDADVEYAAFAVAVLGFLAVSTVVTFGMGFDRTLLVALTALAPFAYVGLRPAAKLLARRLRRGDASGRRAGIRAFAVFLALLFLFSSGGAFAATGQQVPSYGVQFSEDTGWPVYNTTEVDASRWLEQNADPGARVAVFNEWQKLRSRDALMLMEVFDDQRLVPVWTSRTNVNATYFYVSNKPMVSTVEGNDRTYLDPRTTEAYGALIEGRTVVFQNRDVTIYRIDGNNSSHCENASDAGCPGSGS